jgi:cysteinyl-tRNA synthetase, unknown class
MPNSSIPAGIAPQYGFGWSFQVTDNSLDQLINNKAKLLVIDYSKDGSEEERYTKQETDILHQNGKELISYLSIGEAEDYRYYYQSSWKDNPPSWLGKENPDWSGNAKVQYWNPDWQKYMIGYLDKIIDSGFDGIYLDIIDGFDYWSDPGNGEGVVLDRTDAANRMIDFVEKLTEHARVTRGKPNFHIIPQNAEDLLPYDTSGKFLREISGVGVEDLFYEGTTPQSADSIAYRTANLDKITAAGKPVLVIDYVNDTTGYQGANQTRVDDFWTKTLLAGYVPQVSFTDSSILGEDPINQLKIASGNNAVPLPAANPTPVTSLPPVIAPIANPIADIPVTAPTRVEIAPIATPVNIPPVTDTIPPIAPPVTPAATVPTTVSIPVIAVVPNILEVMPPPPTIPTPTTTPPIISPVVESIPVAPIAPVPIPSPVVAIAPVDIPIRGSRGFNHSARKDRQGTRSRRDQDPQSLEQPDILTGTDQTGSLSGNQSGDIIIGDLAQGTVNNNNLEINMAAAAPNIPIENPLDGIPSAVIDIFPRRQNYDFALADRGDLVKPDRNNCRNFRESSGDLQAKPLILENADSMI